MAYPFRAILSPIQFDDPSLLGLGFVKSIAQTLGHSSSSARRTDRPGDRRTSSQRYDAPPLRSAARAVPTLTPTAQQKAAHLKMERHEDVAS